MEYSFGGLQNFVHIMCTDIASFYVLSIGVLYIGILVPMFICGISHI